jgi:hypothetical protein
MSKVLMQILFGAVLFCAVFPLMAAADNVLISQVLYRPSGSDTGGEAVELYNPTSSDIAVGKWIISTETSAADATLPETAIICSHCYYLVADAGWSTAKDNSSFPNADHEETITMANTDAGVALKDANGTIIDAVGWGNPANIGAGLFEGTPTSGSSDGNSLMRKMSGGSYQDSNNNSNDFIDATPSLHNSNSTVPSTSGRADIQVTLVVSGSLPASISSLSILADDDAFQQGIQISPFPGNNRTVKVEAVVSNPGGTGEVSSVTLNLLSKTIAMAKKSDVNSTAAVFSGNLTLSSTLPAGNYTLTATAVQTSGQSASITANFEYLSLIAIEADTRNVMIFAAPGSDGPVDNSAANITLVNSGNVMLDFDVWASNFTSPGSFIDPSKLQYEFVGGCYDSTCSGALSNGKSRKAVNLGAGSKTRLGIRTSLPRTTVPGNYSGIISLVAVESG